MITIRSSSSRILAGKGKHWTCLKLLHLVYVEGHNWLKLTVPRSGVQSGALMPGGARRDQAERRYFVAARHRSPWQYPHRTRPLLRYNRGALFDRSDRDRISWSWRCRADLVGPLRSSWPGPLKRCLRCANVVILRITCIEFSRILEKKMQKLVPLVILKMPSPSRHYKSQPGAHHHERTARETDHRSQRRGHGRC